METLGTTLVPISKRDFSVIALVAAKHGDDPNTFIAKKIFSIAEEFRGEMEKVAIQEQIISAMKIKLQTIPNFVLVFIQHASKMEKTAILIADQMGKLETDF